MFVPLFLSVLAPLALGVAWLGELYRLEVHWQKAQIVLDNAAIHLGQNDLQLIRRLEKDQITLMDLHNRYHQSLACSLVPASALACSKLAETLRGLIRVVNSVSLSTAQSTWSKGTSGALTELQNLKTRFNLLRIAKLPLKERRCLLCREQKGWQLSSVEQTKSSLSQAEKPPLGVSVSLVKLKTGKWNYRLWAK